MSTAVDRGGAAVITVVGIDGRPLEEAALAALARAPVVLGARRHLDAVAHLLPPRAEPRVLGADLSVVDGLPGGAVVLASGDPGFFGIVRVLAERVGAERLTVLPAVSCVAAAFARVGLSWDDAVVVSAHGRDPASAVNACRRYPKVAVLTEPGFGPADLGRALDGLDRRLVVAERLGTPEERIGAELEDAAEPNVVLVLDEQSLAGARGWAFPSRHTPGRWALPETAFAHRDGMVTKAEVRALALAWLGPGPGDLVWDVGAGSGAVGVECARLGAAVIAVDEDEPACRQVRANAERHAVPVQVVHARAPAVLRGLPDPDAVFVGGGGHLLTEITRAAAARVRRVVVVALATVERVGPAIRALADAGLEVDGSLLQAARLAPLGAGHRFAAANPVVLLQGRRA